MSNLPAQPSGGRLSIRDLLFKVRYSYATRLDQQRAAVLLGMLIAVGVGGLLIGSLLAVVALVERPLELMGQVGVIALFSAGIYWLVQIGRLKIASNAFVIMLIATNTILNLPFGIGPGTALGYSVPLVAAAYLLGPASTFLSAALCALGIVGVNYGIALAELGDPAQALAFVARNYDTISTVAILVLVAVVLWLVTNNLSRLVFEAERRADQLEVAAVVSETAGQASSVSELLNLAVERIREIFGFYHAQVFLLDQERRMARLEASTGRAGVALLARGHALPVGSRSVIGQTAYGGKSVIVNDVRENPVHRPNELLPDTRAELAVPLLVGGTVIGALDVQSIQPDAFHEEDVRSLQIIATQLATFIEKTRLVSELATRAEENQRLFEESQGQLGQIEELNRRLTREGWSEYLRAHRTRGALGFTLHGEGIHRDTGWTAPMRQAFQSEHSVVIRQDQHAHIAAIPLSIRGEVIGVLEIERGGGQPWTENDVELAETLVERLALAVENARLYEQATLTAQREQVVNRIAQEVQEASSVDEVLQAALTELGAVLGASRGVVQISTKEEDAPDGQESA